eukprot:CAMPEP_0114526408 /NCGR_PEP_ID=MMETSP0109-20121206/23001_1 /TAXON_ID=29199 /ORGANISM="Chlorarachnion reptans, Strain CCCM449" /LENGTH=193 /DNA_ID=CAMNT_0001708173 /DNA_START=34 /DNA_END=615 /DNA_ORIENTATION=+
MLTLALFVSTVGVLASSQEPRLVFRKTLVTEIPYTYAAGFPINITLDIHNLGTGSAYNLKTSDPWPRDYFDIEGETTAVFEEIKGNEHHQHNFTVTPRFNATPEKPLLYVRGFPAELQFTLDDEGEEPIRAISSQMRDILVRSNEDYIRLTAKHNTEWAIFSIGMTAAVFGPFVAWVILSRKGGLPNAKPKEE